MGVRQLQQSTTLLASGPCQPGETHLAVLVRVVGRQQLASSLIRRPGSAAAAAIAVAVGAAVAVAAAVAASAAAAGGRFAGRLAGGTALAAAGCAAALPRRCIVARQAARLGSREG